MNIKGKIMRMSSEGKRELISSILLESVGCNLEELELIGQGTYNTVYRGHHPDPKKTTGMVALKVASGPEKHMVTEKAAALELEKLKPKDWKKYKDKFSAFARALCVQSVEIEPKYVKQAAYYKKYLNVPELYKEFSYQQVHDILSKKYKNDKDREAIVEILWPSANKKNVAYIFISPLATGDMWNLFESELKNLAEFKQRIQQIRKAAKCTLKALVALHAKGRLHLDIKPDNILCTTNEKGKTVMQLADFGLLEVKTTPNNDRIEEVGEVDEEGFVDVKSTPSPIGSPSSSNSAQVRWKVTAWYKAPEQTMQKMLDLKEMPKIDIYALGATLMIMYEAAKTNSDDARDTAAAYGGVQHLLKMRINYLTMVDKKGMTATSPETRKAEKDLLDLIGLMTDDDPKKRPTAKQALTHPFITTKI